MANVFIPKGVAVDLLAAASIPVGTQVNIVSLSKGDSTRIYNTASTPNTVPAYKGGDDFLPLLGYGLNTVRGESTDAGLWGFNSNGDSQLDIREVL